MYEKDLYEPVKKYFCEKGYLVRGEVEKCDIVAVKDEEIVIIELKKNLSIKLLTQAVNRQRISDKVYMAIIKPKSFRYSKSFYETIHMVRRLELGLIFVSFKTSIPTVELIVEPGQFDIKRSKSRGKKKRLKLYNEVMERHEDYNIGGSVKEKIVTSYREKAVFIACCLQKYGQLSTKALRDLGTDPKKTTPILYDNHYDWFANVKRGVYEITEEGLKGLTEYSFLAEHYNKIIIEKEKMIGKT